MNCITPSSTRTVSQGSLFSASLVSEESLSSLVSPPGSGPGRDTLCHVIGCTAPQLLRLPQQGQETVPALERDLDRSDLPVSGGPKSAAVRDNKLLLDQGPWSFSSHLI